MANAAVDAKCRTNRLVKVIMSNKEYLPVRLSHLLRHCSVGSVVRGPEYLLSVMDISHWTATDGAVAAEEIVYVEHVKSALEISHKLRKPPVAEEREKGKIEGVCVPAVRFPSWMSCPRCGLLHYQPWRDAEREEFPRCQETDAKKCPKRPRLEQVPWVLVHEEGHLTDVPWHFLTHREAATAEQKQCKADWYLPYLRMGITKGKNRILQCLRPGCAAKAIFDSRRPIQYGRRSKQPWLSEPASDLDELASIVEINDTRLHSPVTANALVIPPESRISKGSVVDRVYSTSSFRRELEKARTDLARKAAFKKIARELRCTVEEIREALAEIENGYPLYGKEVTPGLLLESEYQALLGELPDLAEDEDFVPRHYSREWNALLPFLDDPSETSTLVRSVDQLVAVNRLKEIMVMKGFQRLNGKVVPPDILGISDWLPALELYGEGVFFCFREELLAQWELHPLVLERASQLRRRFVRADVSLFQEPVVDPRFIFLHTLAHLMIRQLESQAGYPASSLKERIYSTSGTELPMAGILIYVAVPDVVGSLGGLSELAEPLRFLRLISSVFDHAEWCSVDPVCSEHEGQGPGLLNLAACHACALVPEPCCSYSNLLLDRVLIKGDADNGIPSFLSFQD
ncbi:MAG: DrmB family protein [Pseudomonadota bacterium]